MYVFVTVERLYSDDAYGRASHPDTYPQYVPLILKHRLQNRRISLKTLCPKRIYRQIITNFSNNQNTKIMRMLFA